MKNLCPNHSLSPSSGFIGEVRERKSEGEPEREKEKGKRKRQRGKVEKQQEHEYASHTIAVGSVLQRWNLVDGSVRLGHRSRWELGEGVDSMFLHLILPTRFGFGCIVCLGILLTRLSFTLSHCLSSLLFVLYCLSLSPLFPTLCLSHFISSKSNWLGSTTISNI